MNRTGNTEGHGGPVGPESAPAESAPAESAPAESAPAESAPAESAPAESAPAESAPAESAPAESAPAESAPAESAPAESAPAESAPAESAPAESAPAESAPAESAPAESAPAESAPAESAPAESAPAESAPAESAPAESAPAESAPAESAPGPNAATGLPSACPDPAASYKPEDVSGGSQAPRSSDKETRRRAKTEFLSQVFLLCISIIFSGFSVYITFLSLLDYRPFTAIAAFLAPVEIAFIALVSSSLLLIIPWPRTNRIVRNCAIVLFAAQVATVIISTANGLIFPRNLPVLLGVMAVGLFGLGIALCVAVLWIHRWPLAEKEFLRQFLLLEISVVLAGFSVYMYTLRPSYRPFTSIPGLMYPVGIAFIVALASSSLLLLIEWSHTNRKIRNCAIVLFAAQATVVIISTVNGSISAPNLSALLSVMAFGLFGLGITLCVAVLWIRHWKSYAEPATLGILGIIVTLLCLPGTLAITKQLDGPEKMSSEVYVFATGAPTQKLSVDVAFNPSRNDQSFPNGDPFPARQESFTIYNGSNDAIHWAVLLDNDACFKHLPAKIRHQNIDYIDAHFLSGSIIVSNPDDYFPVSAQLFTGLLAGNSSVKFSGTPIGTFETSTISRSAAYFPTYSQGNLSDVSSTKDKDIIKKALGKAPPATRNSKAFTISLTGRIFDPSLESLNDAHPSPDSTLQSEGVVRWTGHESISNPQYKLLSQNGADAATGGLFIFAVFLGIAGASILASLQSIVKNLLDRKS